MPAWRFRRPMPWHEVVAAKFDRLAAPHADASLRDEIVAAVKSLEAVRVRDLMARLSRARP